MGQDFFASLRIRDSLRAVRPGKTRSRSYLVRYLKNWIASAARRDMAGKREGGVAAVPLHELASAIVPPVPDAASAAEVFERSFARLAGDAVAEGTARKMVFDLRARLGQFLREEVLATVTSPAEADEELRYLLGLL